MVYLLGDSLEFPNPELARVEDGLLAAGGDLSIKRLIQAYCNGIFPWYNLGDPIFWWSPDPRFVLYPEKLHIPKRLARIIRQKKFRITTDEAFEKVIVQCATSRLDKGRETWITPEMARAYINLYRAGYAMSAEAWLGDELVGGLYGVVIGKIFCGESMFSKIADASKVAFAVLVENLVEWGLTVR